MGCMHSHTSCLARDKHSTPLKSPATTIAAPMQFTCDICGQDGMSELEMRSHVLIEHVEGQVSCPFCDLEGTTVDEMEAHVNACHIQGTPSKAPSDTSPSDDRSTDSTGTPREDTSGSSPTEVTITCVPPSPRHPQKDQDSPALKRSRLHLNIPSSQKSPSSQQSSSGFVSPELYPCPMCSWHTSSASDILQHVNAAHLDALSPQGISCPVCALCVTTAAELDAHLNAEHSGEEEQCCPVCGMECSDASSLQLHVDGHFSAGHTPVEDDVLAAELYEEEKRARKENEAKEFAQLQEQYGMSESDSYRQQADRALERAVFSGELTLCDLYSHKDDFMHEASSGVDNGHSCTKGIIEKLYTFYKVSSSNVAGSWLAAPTDHNAAGIGDKGWGCGYRNLQMLLSCLARNPVYLQVIFNGRCQIPSLLKIQRLIEAAWQKGFDREGAEQLGGKLVDTNKWIGATEIVATLSALKVKCQLLDFHAPTGPGSTHPRLFEWVLSYYKSDSDYKPPLYLQHQGHSRTIIGIEELKDGSLRLLLFDPSCNRRQMQPFITDATVTPQSMRMLRRPLNSLKAKQYQIVAVVGTLNNTEWQESKTMKSDRIP